jgi:perosamine synthetase
MKFPVSAPSLGGNEEAYLLDAFRSSWISSSGRYVDRFEADFAGLTGTRHAASAANGTAALHLALVALGVGPGDEVIVPAFTYVATANAVKYCGADPVLVDVSPSTWCIDPAKIEDAITQRTKGIVVVHIYGHPCDMDAINEIAAAHGIWVVEDAAEAHFATYKGRPVGGLSSIGMFSFYGNKVITSGEGGVLTYNSDKLDERIRMLRSQGMDPARRYFHPVVGYNYRLTNLACAILCGQLERRAELIDARNAIFAAYRSDLSGIPGIGFHAAANWAVPAPWLFCITVDEDAFGMSRDALASRLAANGVDSRPFFVPLHLMPPFQDGERNVLGRFPVAEKLGATGLNLPTFGGLARNDVTFICDLIDRLGRTARLSRAS